MYDNRFKLSSTGKIVEVLGNNTYLADVEGKGEQHVSGDVLSKVGDVATRQVGEMEQQQQLEDDNAGVDGDLVEDDSVSVASESSIGSEIFDTPNVPVGRRNPANVPINHVPVRRRRRGRAEMLGPNQVIRQCLRPRQR